MAGHGVGVFYLKSVVVGVFLQLLVAFGLGGHIGIIEHNLLEELLILVVRECWRFGRERVGHCRDLQLVVVVVGESKPKVDEVESVQVAAVAHALYQGTVAVGYERWGRATLLLVVGCRGIGCGCGRRVGVVRCRVLGKSGFVQGGILLSPEVVVLDYHQPVARCQFFLAPQHLAAYALIEYVGALVASCHHHRLVHSHF